MTCRINTLEKFKRGWTSGLPETVCGSGSTMRNTKIQRQWIPEIVESLNIQVISDVGAGDLNWIRKVIFPNDVEYSAFDIFPRHKTIVMLDIRETVPPRSDLILCLWVLNHMDEDDRIKSMRNIRNSGSKWLMITESACFENFELDIVDHIKLDNDFDEIVLAQL